MDTTLRDGEQTSVSFLLQKTIAQLLLELNIDRIEVASARVSEGEFQGVKGYELGEKDTMTESKF
jgi:D-citramalate synthase